MVTTRTVQGVLTTADDLLPEHVELVLSKGIRYFGSAAGQSRRRPSQCFLNAAEFAAFRPGQYDYVEGFAVHPSMDGPVHHAWVARRGTSAAVELTWAGPGLSYVGLPLSTSGPRLTVGIGDSAARIIVRGIEQWGAR